MATPYIGASFEINLTIYGASGSLLDLSDMDLVSFGLRKTPNHRSPKIITKTSADDTEIEITGLGTATVYLTPSDTAKMDVGPSYYSVHVTSDPDIDVVVEPSVLEWEHAPSL